MTLEKKDEIDNLLNHGIEQIYPTRDFLKAKLERGEKLSLYLGIDPTGPSLHIGHAIVLKKLRDFQRFGVKIILLIGDFTGMIGDPTDKTAVRKTQTKEEVLANAKLYKKQASLFLQFSGANKAELKYNSKWLSKMSFEDVVHLASHFTVQQMLERDMFQKRFSEQKPIHLHEFLYPLMQGYDSVALDVDGEIGGNDQTFNMLAGRTLMKQLKGKEKFVITMKLLADSGGLKMGKTTNNAVSLADSPNEMFGKVMSWSDGMILSGFELCTDVSSLEIENIKNDLKNGTNPKDIKVRLAKEVVALYHSSRDADEAEKNFTETFSRKGISDDAEVFSAASGEKIIDVIVRAKLVASKTEARRLFDEGAVSEIGGEKITDQAFGVTKDINVKVGKHRFLKIKVS
ncbi:MAG: tyrosine--tRNA ligase [Candidatus Pacebacteria bacterium]|nr:tyrosine--tRNA ligase [Candidatus Paceibacterota bacterium]MDD5356834.1 tyrosine--tRNA ligase [Candidatus Paceibacterota bacterium]